jgi:transposase-like protein
MSNHRKSSINKWQRIISGAESTTLSASEYCRQNNLSSKSFYAWKTKLRRLKDNNIAPIKRNAVKNWKSIVEGFNSSGLKPMEYCRKMNIPSSSLSTWRIRYRKEIESSNADKFTEVKFKSSEPDIALEKPDTHTGVHISFSDNIKVAVDCNFNESVFSRVVKLLKSELC